MISSRPPANPGTIRNQSLSSPLTLPAGSGFGQSTSAPSLSGLRVVFDNGQFLAWYRERFPINAMLPKPRAGRP
jgi:hypothetical protein